MLVGEFLGNGGFATAVNLIWQWIEEMKHKASKKRIMFNQSSLSPALFLMSEQIDKIVTAPSNLSDPGPVALSQLPLWWPPEHVIARKGLWENKLKRLCEPPIPSLVNTLPISQLL